MLIPINHNLIYDENNMDNIKLIPIEILKNMIQHNFFDDRLLYLFVRKDWESDNVNEEILTLILRKLIKTKRYCLRLIKNEILSPSHPYFIEAIKVINDNKIIDEMVLSGNLHKFQSEMLWEQSIERLLNKDKRTCFKLIKHFIINNNSYPGYYKKAIEKCSKDPKICYDLINGMVIRKKESPYYQLLINNCCKDPEYAYLILRKINSMAEFDTQNYYLAIQYCLKSIDTCYKLITNYKIPLHSSYWEMAVEKILENNYYSKMLFESNIIPQDHKYWGKLYDMKRMGLF